jgi:general secretion pathway protein D
VYGTKHQQRLIHEYLQRIKRLTHIQVTVEAHILEILLKKKYQWGVDWQVLGRRLEGAGIVGIDNKLPGLVSLRLTTPGFKALLGILGEFGHVRTLSNPRLTVLNNQPALMKVVKGEVFFRLEVDRILSSNAKPDLETTTSHMQTIPIGLMMVVQPSVDQSTGEVLLSLRPTVSRVVELRDDPAVSLRSENKIQSKIPVVQTRELDSVLRVHPQETVLMGGLMETTQENSRRGLGPLQQLPVVGGLFGSQEESSSLCELVILLRVWVDQGAAPADLPPQPLPGPTART